MSFKGKVLAAAKHIGKDFFGFEHMTYKEISGVVASTLTAEQISKKYELLLRSRHAITNEESIKCFNFGEVRRDEDNLALDHGHYEEENSEFLYDPESLKRFVTTSVTTDNIKLSKPISNSPKDWNIDKDDPFKCEIRIDFKGFNDFHFQTPRWYKCSDVEITEYLTKNILYHNNDILALNKPYGLESHHPINPMNIDNLMQKVGKIMRIDKLYLAHRLDKNTTGVLLFATSQKRADDLNNFFKTAQIKKTYLCIVKGVPSPEHAIIDIPIGEHRVDLKMRRCLVPEKIENFKQLSPKVTEAKRAITEYRVLSKASGMSLLEVKPQTGVTHQIRCHLGMGLRTPILGDHKYSHVDRVCPQKLHLTTLNALHLRQSKVRTLPTHLHAYKIIVPQVKASQQNLFITAPLPGFFLENMKLLKLDNNRFR